MPRPRPATETAFELLPALRPTHDDIAARAFRLYESRGATDGADVDDWLEAERQLRDERVQRLAAS